MSYVIEIRISVVRDGKREYLWRPMKATRAPGPYLFDTEEKAWLAAEKLYPNEPVDAVRVTPYQGANQ